MAKSRNELLELAEKMVLELGEEAFIHELLDALSTDEIEENLEFIDRMYCLEIFED